MLSCWRSWSRRPCTVRWDGCARAQKGEHPRRRGGIETLTGIRRVVEVERAGREPLFAQLFQRRERGVATSRREAEQIEDGKHDTEDTSIPLVHARFPSRGMSCAADGHVLQPGPLHLLPAELGGALVGARALLAQGD